MKIQKLLGSQRALMILFITWFFYSAGILSWMALNDSTPSHCFILENEKSL
jgi:hypothetical protein